MKFQLGLIISFIFISFSPYLDSTGFGDSYFEIDQKNTFDIARAVAPQKVVQKKKIWPGFRDQKIFSCTEALLMNPFFSSSIHVHKVNSNFMSSGAKTNQYLAST